jgi:hypothetical protein
MVINVYRRSQASFQPGDEEMENSYQEPVTSNYRQGGRETNTAFGIDGTVLALYALTSRTAIIAVINQVRTETPRTNGAPAT